MRFYLFVLFSGICFSLPLKAQCPVPNGDFEILGDLTDTLSNELDLQLKFPVTAPQGWIPLLRPVAIAFSDFIVDFFDKDTLDIDVFSGLKSYVPGANGSEKAILLAGDELAYVSDVIQFFACSSRPEKVTGYYKYNGELIRDSLSILVLLMNEPSLNEQDAIGIARFNTFGGPLEYTQFEATFNYVSDAIPDTAVILIAAERYEEWPGDSSSYVIDEIAFEGGIVPTRDMAIKEQLFLSPNPVDDVVFLNEIPEAGTALTIYNELGILVYEIENIRSQKISLRDFLPGIYFARLGTETQVSIQKIIKQ